MSEQRFGADLEAQLPKEVPPLTVVDASIPVAVPVAVPMDTSIAREIEANMATLDKMERSIRHAFARKVFALLALCICIVQAIICIFLYVPEVNAYVNGPGATWIVVVSGFLFLLTMVALSCIPEFNRKYPANVIGLFALASVAGVFLGSLCAGVVPEYVWICFASSVGIMLVCGIFACQTRFDFTGIGPFLSVAVMFLLIFSLFGGFSFTLRSEYANGSRSIVWCAIGVFVFSLYVVYDMQLVVGGKHRMQFGVDDYILGTIALFTDFLMIFALMLGALGGHQ